MKNKKFKCNTCGKRGARYPDEYSFDRLCQECRKKTLIKAIESVHIALIEELKKNNLPLISISFYDFSPEFTDSEGYKYPESLHFNIEAWSSHKYAMTWTGIMPEGPVERRVPSSLVLKRAIEDVKNWFNHVKARSTPEELKKFLEYNNNQATFRNGRERHA